MVPVHLNRTKTSSISNEKDSSADVLTENVHEECSTKVQH